MAARKTPSPGREPGVKNAKRDPLFPPGAITKAHCELAHALALLGKDDRGVAAVFGVSERTLNDYKRDSTFKEALVEGKAVADARVAAALYRSATGFRSEQRTTIEGEHGAKTIYEETEVPPDTRAATFWLSNRQPSHWSLSARDPSEGEPEDVERLNATLEELIHASDAVTKLIGPPKSR